MIPVAVQDILQGRGAGFMETYVQVKLWHLEAFGLRGIVSYYPKFIQEKRKPAQFEDPEQLEHFDCWALA